MVDEGVGNGEEGKTPDLLAETEKIPKVFISVNSIKDQFKQGYISE